MIDLQVPPVPEVQTRRRPEPGPPPIARRRHLARTLLALVLVVAVGSVLIVFRAEIWGPQFNHSGYSLSRDGQSPYIGNYVIPLTDTTWGETSEDDVLITRVGNEAVYHPVNSAWYINQMLTSFKESNNPEYLDRAIATAKYLINVSATDDRGAIWFPYRFGHDVKTLRLGAPWHSGMAQGMMLSTFVNLYEATGDKYWKKMAAGTVKSFDQPKVESGPWFTNVIEEDGKKFVFYEEYPALAEEQNTQVVNGHIYALYGLYDYYRITGDKRIEWLFDVGASSIRDSFDAYRNPGQASWYSPTEYGRTVWGNPEKYHKGVISQLRTLGEITGDVAFWQQADILYSDFHE
ncbi:D-glucuronyl C5-epimerase family protein [Arthrobacter sp. H35-D1]|uniref:D-glucuronyl C5-epimerase family protein n=1 Tax=Arthrobacter sp. H35-D1 TaxID=3046202 RepID=UPI0024B9545E|nr:D-glucuronyl C5-epimerase family protein [Arthrobacter sp. H35-D1]MDJ0312972.1 D-glucuronyl C5-epimerase family protein [Arthrobacter sp. H35-D1]